MKISLIIPSYNSAKYISKAIDSFIKQDYEDKELIIIDNKSTDDSHKIIDIYQKSHPDIIKWIKEDDKGISHARNIALKQVSGDLVGFLGADDFLHDDFFKIMAYYAKINPDFDIIYFNSYKIGKNSSFDASSQIKVNKRNLIKYCPIGSGESFYYRKNIFDKFTFNENNRYSMDYELNYAIASSKKENNENYEFFPVNFTAIFNGTYGDSISSSLSLKQRLETIAIQLKYAKNFTEKLKIFFAKKKLIIKNLTEFNKIKNNL